MSSHIARFAPLTMALSALLVATVGAPWEGSGATRQLGSWRIDTVAQTRIGDSPADPLHEVRGVVLTSRFVVVGERSSGTIRFYSHDGRLVKTAGRLGEGPGEYRSLSWLRRHNGNLFAYDSRLRRLTEYTLEGMFLRSVQVRPVGRYMAVPVVGVFSDGTLLVRGMRGPLSAHKPHVRRDAVTLLRFDSEGQLMDSVGWYEATEAYVEPYGNRGSSTGRVAFGRQSQVSVAGSEYLVLTNDSYVIDVFSPDGERDAALSPTVLPAPVPVRAADVELIRSRLRNEWPDLADRLVARLERMPIPEYMPPYGWESWEPRSILTVVGDTAWALNYGGVSDEPPVWTVYHIRAGEVGSLTAPDDVELHDIVDGLAAVVRRTEYDEEIVEVRRVLR